MLSPLDDYPIHQIQEPIRHVGTSDRNFYDRYYLNGFALDGSAMFIAGIGVYPNLGVMDAFVLVFRNGQHRVVRASRTLDGADRLHPSAGPISIDIIEPLRQLRLSCADNEFGISMDATWTGAMEAFLEPRHYIREFGRTIFDSSRFAQTGGWDGTITVDGETISLSDATWWGTRDRSWGIRPVGESEPQGIRATAPFHWWWLYTPIRFEDHSILVIVQERGDGSKVMEEAVRIWHDDNRIEVLGHPRHEIHYIPGTRRASGAVIHLTEPDGSPLELKVEAMLPTYVGIGTGYGYDADWKHGMYQGELAVQGVHIDTTTPEGAAQLFGLVDASGRFSYGDHVGYGLFEHMAVGPNAQYGFKDLMDGYEP